MPHRRATRASRRRSGREASGEPKRVLPTTRETIDLSITISLSLREVAPVSIEFNHIVLGMVQTHLLRETDVTRLRHPSRRRYGSPMIRIGKLEQVISGVVGADVRSVRNRLQYLAVNGFPPGLRVGRAKRADYGLEEVYALNLVFALARGGMPPAAAAAVVGDYWPELAFAMVNAGGRAISKRSPGAKHEFVLVGAERLPVSSGSRKDGTPTDSYGVDVGRLADLEKSAMSGTGASLLMDIDALYRAIHAGLTTEPDAVPVEDIEKALLQTYRDQALQEGSLDASADAAVSYRDLAPPDRGLRLCEQDYFFARAIELIDAAGGGPTFSKRRLSVFAAYLARPAPIEAWKRRVPFVAGTSFVEGLAVFAEPVLGTRFELAESEVAAARERLEAAFIAHNADDLGERLRDRARTGRGIAPI